MAGAVQNLGTNIQKLRDTQDKILGENFLASAESFLSEFEGKLKFDKTSYQTDEQLKATKEQFNTYLEEYKAIAEKQGYDPRIANAYITAAQKRARETDFKFLEKNVKYQEEQTKEYFLQGLDTKSQNNARNMTNGDYKKAFDGFFNRSNELFQGAKEGYLDPSKVVDEIVKERKNLVEANISSIVNQPGSLNVLKNMSKWNFQNFDAYYNQLNMQIEGQDLLLNEDDFKAFQTSVNTGIRRGEALQKKDKEKTLYQEMELKAKRLVEPKEQAIKEGGYLAGTLIRNYPEIHVNSVNNQQGKEVVKSIDDIVNYNYTFPLSKAEDLSDITKSGEVSLEEIMKLRDDRTNRNVGGYGERIENHFEDTTGAEENIPGGSRYKKAYWTNPEFKNQMNSIYSLENQKKLKAWGNDKVKLDFSFDKDIAVLKAAGEMGDFEAKRTAEALERIATDKVLIDIYDKNEGKIEQSYFTGKLDGTKKGKFRENEYIPIEELTTDKKQLLAAKSIEDSIFPSWLKTSGRDNIKSTLENSKKALLANETKIDLGERGTIFLKENVDPVVTSNKINEGIKNMTFYTANPDGLIETTRGNKKKIKVEKVPQSNKIFFLYNGEAQRDKEGKIIFLEVKE